MAARAMTPAEQQKLIDETVGLLKATTVGWANHSLAWQNNQTTKWWQALDRLRRLRADLDPAPPPTPPPATGWPKYGISTGYKILTRSQADFDFELDQIKAVGAQFVRSDSLPGNQSQVDRFVTGVTARGMEPMLVLHGTTNTITPTAAADFAKAQATKWKGKVRLFEFCNEPDLQDWNPETYTAAAKAAYPALKAGNPNARLIVGALWKWKDVAGQKTFDWVKRMIAAGINGHLDALSIHLYDDPYQHGDWNIWDATFYRTPSIRSIMDAAGMQNVPICSTENGAPIAHYTIARQAEIVANDFKALTTYPLLFHTVFCMMDDEFAAAQYGLLDANRQRRPSWQAYRDAVGR